MLPVKAGVGGGDLADLTPWQRNEPSCCVAALLRQPGRWVPLEETPTAAKQVFPFLQYVYPCQPVNTSSDTQPTGRTSSVTFCPRITVPPLDPQLILVTQKELD